MNFECWIMNVRSGHKKAHRLNPDLPVHVERNPAHPLCRPFRAWNPAGAGSQGVGLGCGMMPRWGGRKGPMRPSGASRRMRS